MDIEGDRRVTLPNDLPVIERSAVRIVVLDTQDKLLLFHTHDLDHPDLGTWWELPGGGIDPGETYLDAAIRELREERGDQRTFRAVVIAMNIDAALRTPTPITSESAAIESSIHRS